MNLFIMLANTVPDNINIPRYHTGVAEWLFAFTFILFLPKRYKGMLMHASHVLWLAAIIGFQLLAGTMPLGFWVPNMIFAVVLMFTYIILSSKVNVATAIFFVIIAFTLAEFAASLEWQISYYFQLKLTDFTLWVEVGVLVLVYAIIFILVYLLERKHKGQIYQVETKRNDLVSMILIGVSVFTISNMSFISGDTPFSGQYPSEIFYIRTLVDLAGIMLLYSLREHKRAVYSNHEAYTMQKLLDKQYEQYQLSIRNTDIISHRYHDLKHYINLMRMENDASKKESYLEDLEKTVKPYENQYQTGNNVLDILLMQKGNDIIENRINFTCVVDGKLLDHISVLDMLSIFGNALDNAIESSKKIEKEEERIIKLAVSRQNQLIFIKIDNYYIDKLNIIDGEFVTTKSNKQNHGYGLKSISSIVQKYGGSLKITTADHWFTLMILLPVNE